MTKKANWVVKVLTAIEPGRATWKDLKTFTNPAEADNWLCDFCRKNGCSITDFNIVKREA